MSKTSTSSNKSLESGSGEKTAGAAGQSGTKQNKGKVATRRSQPGKEEAFASWEQMFWNEMSAVPRHESAIGGLLDKIATKIQNAPLKGFLRQEVRRKTGQVTRIENVLRKGADGRSRPKSGAFDSFLKITEKIFSRGNPSAIRDAWLVAQIQKLSHFQIAAYGTLACWAHRAGCPEACEEMDQFLRQEKEADRELTMISRQEGLLPRHGEMSTNKHTERTGMNRRHDYDEDDRYSRGRLGGQGRYEEEDEGRGGRGGASRGGRGRGFENWDREELREVAARGGRHSHGGHGYDDDEDYDSPSTSRSSRGGYDDEEEDYGRGGRQSRGGSSGGRGRGFENWDREELREVSARGGRHSHDNDDDYDDDGGSRSSSRSRRGGGYEYDEEEDYGSSRSSRGGSSGSSRSSSGGSRRGFAAMDPEKQRRIAAMGGRASHGGRSSGGR